MEWLDMFLDGHAEAFECVPDPQGLAIAVDGTRVAMALASMVSSQECSVLRVLDLEVERVMQVLRRGGMRIHVLMDPAYGTEAGSKQEELYGLQFLSEAHRARGARQLGSPPPFWCALPPLVTLQFVRTVQRLGIPVEYCTGAAVFPLAGLVRTGAACSVLSTDTDFALMPGCRLTPLARLQAEGADLPRGLPVVSPASLAASLGLTPPRLPDWAALCGNRFTRGVLAEHRLLEWLSVGHYASSDGAPAAYDPLDIARLLARTPLPLHELPALSALTRRTPAIAVAFLDSRQYYGGGPPARAAVDEGWPPPLSKGQFTAGALPECALAVALHRRWWGSPYAGEGDAAHRPLRRVLYGLLCGGESYVTEHCAGGGPDDLPALTTAQVITDAPLYTLQYLRRLPLEERRAAYFTAVLQCCAAADFLGSAVADAPRECQAHCLLLWYATAVGRRELRLSPGEVQALALMLSSALGGAAPPESPTGPPSARVVEVVAMAQASLGALHDLALLYDLPELFAPLHAFVDTLLLARLLASREARARLQAVDGPQGRYHCLRTCAEAALEHGTEDTEAGSPTYKPHLGRVRLPTFALPIMSHWRQIVDTVGRQRVTLLSGTTSSGKSSGLPLILLDAHQQSGDPFKIVITQPRRVACFTLAKFVAAQLHEPVGHTVGFRVHQDRQTSHATCIEYTTTGYLLELLAHSPSLVNRCPQGCVIRYTHIVMDEVHERTSETDLLALLFTQLLQKDSAAKLIIMSATLDACLYQSYFAKALRMPELPHQPVLSVGHRAFPVTQLYLDEVLQAKPLQKWTDVLTAGRAHALCALWGRTGPPAPAIPAAMHAFAADLVVALAKPASCVLVFLPGLAEICEFAEVLRSAAARLASHPASFLNRAPRRRDADLQVRVLHSLIPPEEQQLALQPCAAAKVLLATNIAESSITVPDAAVVLDFALHRVPTFNRSQGLPGLSRRWCSRACLEQRAGRVGRLSAGHAIHLLPRRALRGLAQYTQAELLRLPVSRIALRVKLALPGSPAGVKDLLARLPEPPPRARLTEAAKDLYRSGAIVQPHIDAAVTRLGSLAAALPVDLPLARLVVLAIHAGCAAVGVTVAAAASVADLFRAPHPLYTAEPPDAFHGALLRNLRARQEYDGRRYSEPAQALGVARDWWSSGKNAAWAAQNDLNVQALRQMDTLVLDVCHVLLQHTATDATVLQLQRLRNTVAEGHPRRSQRHSRMGQPYRASLTSPLLTDDGGEAAPFQPRRAPGRSGVASLLSVPGAKLQLLASLAFGPVNNFLIATPSEGRFRDLTEGAGMDRALSVALPSEPPKASGQATGQAFGAEGAGSPGQTQDVSTGALGRRPTMRLSGSGYAILSRPTGVVVHCPPAPIPPGPIQDAPLEAKLLFQLSMLRGLLLMPNDCPRSLPSCAMAWDLPPVHVGQDGAASTLGTTSPSVPSDIVYTQDSDPPSTQDSDHLLTQELDSDPLHTQDVLSCDETGSTTDSFEEERLSAPVDELSCSQSNASCGDMACTGSAWDSDDFEGLEPEATTSPLSRRPAHATADSEAACRTAPCAGELTPRSPTTSSMVAIPISRPEIWRRLTWEWAETNAEVQPYWRSVLGIMADHSPARRHFAVASALSHSSGKVRATGMSLLPSGNPLQALALLLGAPANSSVLCCHVLDGHTVQDVVVREVRIGDSDLQLEFTPPVSGKLWWLAQQCRGVAQAAILHDVGLALCPLLDDLLALAQSGPVPPSPGLHGWQWLPVDQGAGVGRATGSDAWLQGGEAEMARAAGSQGTDRRDPQKRGCALM